MLPNNVQITIYANDTTITVLCSKHHKSQQLIQPYFHKIYEWVTNNNLNINTDKTTTLLTPNPAKYGTTKQSNTINNKTHKNFWFFTRPKAFNTFTTYKCNNNQNKRTFNIFKALIFTK